MTTTAATWPGIWHNPTRLVWIGQPVHSGV